VRPWLFLRALQERHQIDLVTLAGGPPASGIGTVARAFRPTATDRLAALRHLPDRAFPLQAMAIESLAMRRAVRTAIARGGYDVIHVEHVRALHLVPEPDRPRVLFDAVDCLYDLFDQAAPYQSPARRPLFRHEARRLERFEAKAITAVPRVLVASRRDAAALLRLAPHAPISVLPNPVDLLRFRPQLDRSPNTVVFTGKMSFHANQVAARWLCDEIWPLVQVRHPLRYAVGMQNKVLEAMACAIPVVTTTVAVGDLGFAEGGHGFVANDAPSFAERICWLLDDRRLAGEMGRAGRDYVERYHAVGPLADQLDRYYHDLCGALKPEQEKSEVRAI
jgi:glycosyltransferase involved in cell wall biosynthesis